MRIERLGWSAVKGTTWLTPDALTIDEHGALADRQWSPVAEDLTCLKATEVPHLAGLRILPEELPTGEGESATVTYWGRPFPATLHDGPVAEKISELVGRPVRLAWTSRRPGFIWSSPISVVLRSELVDLPTDTDRYRANIVIDDRDAPLRLAPGIRCELGEVTLEVERELDRCVVIDHNPVTGTRDAQLLPRLRAGVLLGYGCTVVQAGTLRVGEA